MTSQQGTGHFALPTEPDRNLPPPAEEPRRMEDKQVPRRVLGVEMVF